MSLTPLEAVEWIGVIATANLLAEFLSWLARQRWSKLKT